MARNELYVKRLIDIDEAQRDYHSWRESTYIFQTEDSKSVLEKLAQEIKEFEEALKKPWKNRLNIAAEAADIFIFSLALLDHEDTLISSLFSNGKEVKFFDELQEIAEKRIKDSKRFSPNEILQNIKTARNNLKSYFSGKPVNPKENIKEIILSSSQIIAGYGLPVGAVISGKLARNEDKYPRYSFAENSLIENSLALGLVGQSLQEQVRLMQVSCRNQWDSRRDSEYLLAAMTPKERNAFNLRSAALVPAFVSAKFFQKGQRV